MVYLGLEPGVAGWKAQTNPLSNGGTPFCNIFPAVRRLQIFCRALVVVVLWLTCPPSTVISQVKILLKSTILIS